MPLTDAEMKAAVRDHSPLQLGNLRFTYVSDYGYRVDLPTNRDEEAVMLTPEQAEQLCRWFLLRVDVEPKENKVEAPPPPSTISVPNGTDGPHLSERIRKSLRKVRAEAGYASETGDCRWLSLKIKKSASTIHRYVYGKNVPRNGVAERIADVLGWSREDMMRWCWIERKRKYVDEIPPDIAGQAKENHA